MAFRHPTAGKQFVKGSIEGGEAASVAALRELAEESGIIIVSGLCDLGQAPIGAAVWHFFAIKIDSLPDQWAHQTHDDFNHVFAFFWHPLAEDLNGDWHPRYQEALDFIRRSVPQ
ncbi:NUDIX domain-containing protein [Sphingomonas glaciei]|uniref:NUDIX domain-containing protein n=1 Tax=Sphingomonas glaciei TaxID=2938948 RepID=A0ABY5MXG9_9SPHN|nr:NUDIX domain-containing protein [Sphingomonas glaciei]UUR08179.1 NUDIX domain-containing protein [Sphingomonas glaciei]